VSVVNKLNDPFSMVSDDSELDQLRDYKGTRFYNLVVKLLFSDHSYIFWSSMQKFSKSLQIFALLPILLF
jgi:hypothetical protein